MNAIVLIAIDNQADAGLPNYGDLMRLVVWGLIAYSAVKCILDVNAAVQVED
jgi:hypothetical protein